MIISTEIYTSHSTRSSSSHASI